MTAVADKQELAIDVSGMTKRFGSRTVVDHIDCKCVAERFMDFSVRTAAARRRLFACCADCFERTKAAEPV